MALAACTPRLRTTRPWRSRQQQQLLSPRLHQLQLSNSWRRGGLLVLRRQQVVPARAPAPAPCRAAAAATARPFGRGEGDGGDGAADSASEVQGRGWAAHLLPLDDPAANRKLLSLCAAQMLASFATDLHDTFLPLYQRDVLGMTHTGMGNLHALLQLLPPALGVLSGWLADRFTPARMVIAGSVLTALVCKPMFALCGTVRAARGAAACLAWIAAAKVLDRAVKGVRETPTKALVGELAAQSGDPQAASAAFSVRHTLSTLGMLLGAQGAALALRLSGGDYEATFLLSAVPAALGAVLAAASLGGSRSRSGRTPPNKLAPAAATVAEGPSAQQQQQQQRAQQQQQQQQQQLGLAGRCSALLGAFPAAYWQALLVSFLLFLARYDVAFRSLHAATVMSKERLPVLMYCSMAPVVALAAPVGMRAKSSVRARNAVLAAGMAACLLGNLILALVPSFWGMVAGSVCVGVHMAMAQGVLYGMLASYIPAGEVPGLGRISGTSWSLTELLLGVALAGSNALAGHLSDFTLRRGLGSTGCFLGACAACAASLAALLAFSAWGQLGGGDMATAAAAEGRGPNQRAAAGGQAAR